MYDFSPASVGDGRMNNDPRTYLHNGQWVDPRTVQGIGGTTYAGPADANGYTAGTAPAGATPYPTYGGQTQAPASAPSGGNPYLPGGNAAPAQPQAGTQHPGFANGNWWNDMQNAVTSGVNKNLMERIMPGIRQGFRAGSGGLGSSSQGIVESRAVGDANSSIAQALAGQYLQGQSVANSRELGLGQLQLGNRNTDLNQTQLGANLWNMGNTGMGQIGSGMSQLGAQQQQAPWTVLGNATNNYQNYTGLGGTKVGSSESGGGLSGLLGGLLGGANLANNWGLFGNKV